MSVQPSSARARLALPFVWWRQRWRSLSPTQQDRLAAVGPLLSVLLFLAAIFSAITYFTLEELNREQEAVTRDVEYAQQRLRLRLLERQEQLMRIARAISNQEIEETEFVFQIETLVSQYPELHAVTWVNQRREVVTSYASPSAPPHMLRQNGDTLSPEAPTAHLNWRGSCGRRCTPGRWAAAPRTRPCCCWCP